MSDWLDANAPNSSGGGGDWLDKNAPVSADDIRKAMGNRAIQGGLMFGAASPDVAMGARQVVDSLAQMGARGLDKLGITTGLADKADAGSKAVYDQYQKMYQPEATLPGAGLARSVGQAAVTAPLMPMRAAGLPGMVGQGAAYGAAGSALTPVYNHGNDFWQQKGGQAATGAVVGGLTAGALGAAGRVLSPNVSQDVHTLMDAGVTPTPGSVMGGLGKSIEDKATSIPLLGDAINAGKRRSIDEFNTAVYARTLAPLGPDGLAVAKSAPVGSAGIAKVGDYLSDRYNALLDKSVPADIAPFQQTTGELTAMVPQALRQDFTDTIQRAVLSKVTPAGTLPPNAAKDAESELGQAIRDYASGQGGERVMGKALRQAQSNLRDAIAASNPVTGPQIQQVNKGWANLTQLENAGSMLGAKNGVISPAQYLNAIKRGDNTIRDRDFARGTAMNQDLGRAADNVLPNKYPDSGSIGRALVGMGGTGLLGAINPMIPAAGAVGSLAYTPMGQKAIAALLAKRPQSAQLSGDLLKQIAPYLGFAAPAGLLGQP